MILQDREYPDSELPPSSNMNIQLNVESEASTGSSGISVEEVLLFLKYCIPSALSLIKPAKTDRVLDLQEALDDRSKSGRKSLPT